MMDIDTLEYQEHRLEAGRPESRQDHLKIASLEPTRLCHATGMFQVAVCNAPVRNNSAPKSLLSGRSFAVKQQSVKFIIAIINHRSQAAITSYGQERRLPVEAQWSGRRQRRKHWRYQGTAMTNEGGQALAKQKALIGSALTIDYY